jgi:hypothetical protein
MKTAGNLSGSISDVSPMAVLEDDVPHTAVARLHMANTSTTEELRWAQQERIHAGDRRAANRVFLKSFVAMLFLLVTAVTVATLLATRVNKLRRRS